MDENLPLIDQTTRNQIREKFGLDPLPENNEEFNKEKEYEKIYKDMKEIISNVFNSNSPNNYEFIGLEEFFCRKSNNPEFKKGDVVSRDGTDEYLIYDINSAGDLIEVICIKELLTSPRNSPWMLINETKSDPSNRYIFKYHIINWQEKLKIINKEDLINGRKISKI